VHGRDLGRFGERLELPTEPSDVHVERVVMDDRSVWPRSLDKLAATHDVAWRTGKSGEDPELGRRQIDGFVRADRRVRARVEPQTACLHCEVGAPPLDQGSKASNELGEGEGLREIVVASGREPSEPIVQGVTSREEDDRSSYSVRSERLHDVASVRV